VQRLCQEKIEIYLFIFCYREKEMISGRNISGKSVVTGLLAMTAAAILLTAGLNNSALNSNSNQAVAH
jgi:hypothetical protein